MNLSAADLDHLADVAISAATTAGEMIAESRPDEVLYKDRGVSLAAQVVTEVDRRSEELILDILAPSIERFGLGVLTEERDDDGSRLTAEHFWCVDPLDGTLPFINGSHGYAVSIALVTRAGTPLIGVVYDPCTGTLLQAVNGGRALLNRQPWTPPQRTGTEPLTLYADHSFTQSDLFPDVFRSLEQTAFEMGLDGVKLETGAGAVMNALGVFARAAACYVKFPQPSGGGHSWDFAATSCLAHAMGAVATDIHAAPLDLNRPDSTAMNHRGVVFASDDDLAQHLRALYAELAE